MAMVYEEKPAPMIIDMVKDVDTHWNLSFFTQYARVSQSYLIRSHDKPLLNRGFYYSSVR